LINKTAIQCALRIDSTISLISSSNTCLACEGVVKGIAVGSNEDPRERLRQATQTRYMTMWHDHSDIAGK